jgi:uncharacterized membrane protein YoaK (UPF0700 family)
MAAERNVAPAGGKGMSGAPPRPPQAQRILPLLLGALTAVTGMIDAVSYLGLGHVFTANMTGNIVLLGFAFAGAGQVSITGSLLALGAFLLGAAVGGVLVRRLETVHHRWMGTALGLEAALLLSAAIAAIPRTQATDYLTIVPLALGMGIRNATVRRLAVPDMTTTVLTLTLTGLAADTQLPGGEPRPAAVRRIASVVSMLVGALVGALLLRSSLALPLFVAATLVSVFTVAYVAHALPPHEVDNASPG